MSVLDLLHHFGTCPITPVVTCFLRNPIPRYFPVRWETRITLRGQCWSCGQLWTRNDKKPSFIDRSYVAFMAPTTCMHTGAEPEHSSRVDQSCHYATNPNSWEVGPNGNADSPLAAAGSNASVTDTSCLSAKVVTNSSGSSLRHILINVKFLDKDCGPE
jgi:hypothetical protein